LLAVWWQVWRNSNEFRSLIHKITAKELNSDRPNWLSEIEVGEIKILGPPPTIFDVNFLTSLLGKDPETESLLDAKVIIKGPIETSIKTEVCVQWPKSFRVPVFVKVVLHSLTAGVRLQFSCKADREHFLAEQRGETREKPAREKGGTFLQWIGKPQLRISVEPRIGSDFCVK